MALRLIVWLLLLVGCAAPLAHLDQDRLAPSPPTPEEFRSMLAAGRHIHSQPVQSCAAGLVYQIILGFEADPTDLEWVVGIGAWRRARPLLIVHFGRGAEGRAEDLWADRDGDGHYELHVSGAEAIAQALDRFELCGGGQSI